MAHSPALSNTNARTQGKARAGRFGAWQLNIINGMSVVVSTRAY